MQLIFCYRTALVNQNEDLPGMNFLNTAFDSSTFIRTNYNYLQSFAANNNTLNALGAKLLGANEATTIKNVVTASKKLTTSSFNLANNANTANTTLSATSGLKGNQANSVLPVANSGGAVVNRLNGPNNSANLLGPSGADGVVGGRNAGKPSLTKHYGSTNENRALWLQHLAAASASAKKAYCSKTQIYSDAVSRALDIQTCKVVPFFGAFLHDLRYIIETVPSVTIMCNRNIQKPIEVQKKKYFNTLFWYMWMIFFADIIDIYTNHRHFMTLVMRFFSKNHRNFLWFIKNV